MTKMADRESLLQAFSPNCYGDGNVYRGVRIKDSETKTTYVEPPKKEWVGLTGGEVNECAAGCQNGNSVQDAIRKAEAKLKEKNT